MRELTHMTVQDEATTKNERQTLEKLKSALEQASEATDDLEDRKD